MTPPSDAALAPAETGPAEAKPAAPSRSDCVRAIAAALAREDFGTGPLASLRRLDPEGALGVPALHRLLARHVPEEWVRGEGLCGWALVIHCLALAAPDHLFGEARLGRALHDARFAETRLANLLDATPEELRTRLPRAVRFLVHRGGRVHAPQLADLVLTPVRLGEADNSAYDRLRQRIAGDYYRAENEASKSTGAPSAAA